MQSVRYFRLPNYIFFIEIICTNLSHFYCWTPWFIVINILLIYIFHLIFFVLNFFLGLFLLFWLSNFRRVAFLFLCINRFLLYIIWLLQILFFQICIHVQLFMNTLFQSLFLNFIINLFVIIKLYIFLIIKLIFNLFL
jgi:hypothetical protein